MTQWAIRFTMRLMKRCPECSTQYQDGVNFCAKDGKSLTAQIVARTRLCPNCANSIAEDAPKCPYCKTELGSSPTPQWPTRTAEVPQEATPKAETNKLSAKAKIILALGLLGLALGVFYLIGGHQERGDLVPAPPEKLKELQEKEQKIQTLEAQLAQTRQELQGRAGQLEKLQAKVDEGKQELSATRQQLNEAKREVERLSVSRVSSSPKPSARPVEPPPAVPARPASEPGLYETVRATSVYEEPSGSARVLSQIDKGTRVTVVRSMNGWLEVRSKQGNPPGFIRSDDAALVSRAN